MEARHTHVCFVFVFGQVIVSCEASLPPESPCLFATSRVTQLSASDLQVGPPAARGPDSVGGTATIGVCLERALQLRRQPVLPIRHVPGPGVFLARQEIAQHNKNDRTIG